MKKNKRNNKKGKKMNRTREQKKLPWLQNDDLHLCDLDDETINLPFDEFYEKILLPKIIELKIKQIEHEFDCEVVKIIPMN